MEDTKPKCFVFVLMPFSDQFTDIYEFGIKLACKEAGAYCERVDEQAFDGNIVDRIYNQISKADIIVADMTGRNPNVFYETGYAHALNKKVILLTQQVDDIPFDLIQYPHIVYGSMIALLKTKLEKRIQWYIENPEGRLSKVDFDLELFVNNTNLIDAPEISVIPRVVDSSRIITLPLSIHNNTKQLLRSDAFNLSMVLPWNIELKEDQSFIGNISELPTGLKICKIDIPINLFPDAWYSLSLDMFYYVNEYEAVFADAEIEENVEVPPSEVIFRLFTEFGPTDYPFTVKLGSRSRRRRRGRRTSA